MSHSTNTQRKRRFWGSQQGNVGIVFALAAFPMLCGIGSAVDLMNASSQRTRLQSAADAAVLAGAVAAKGELDKGVNERRALATARRTSVELMRSNFQGQGYEFEPSFSLNGLTVSGTATAKYVHPTSFMQMFGTDALPVQARSQAQATMEPFLNIYLLIDISASMLLPATNDGITQMRNGTGCALACHDKTDGTDTYGYAKRNNILMRYEVVNQGVDNLLNYIRSRQTISGRLRVELWSFDHDMRKLVPLTSDLSRVSGNFPAPALASTEESAATRFDELIDRFVAAVGTSGAGATQQDAKKLVMIATDGVNDPTRAWTWDTPLRDQVRAINTSFCDTLKSRGNTVAVINTPYLPMPWDWGYNATLGMPGLRGGATRVDDVPLVLKQCAGAYFTIASDAAAIRSSFIDLYTAASAVKLSK